MSIDQDKKEIADLVEKSTGETVDTYAEELVNPGVENDPYSELHMKVRLFPFGKMMADSRGMVRSKIKLFTARYYSTCLNELEAM